MWRLLVHESRSGTSDRPGQPGEDTKTVHLPFVADQGECMYDTAAQPTVFFMEHCMALALDKGRPR